MNPFNHRGSVEQELSCPPGTYGDTELWEEKYSILTGWSPVPSTLHRLSTRPCWREGGEDVKQGCVWGYCQLHVLQEAPRLPHLHPRPSCPSGWGGREAQLRQEVLKASSRRLNRCTPQAQPRAGRLAPGALGYRGLGMVSALYPSRRFPWGLCAWPESSTVGILDSGEL